MELNLEEQTLVATFRSLDDQGKKEMLRHASQQHKSEATALIEGLAFSAGHCRLDRKEERPETISDPIFTE